MVEEWRTLIYNDEVFNDYEVSTLGNVRSLKRGKIKILKLHDNGTGYLVATLYKDGKHKQRLIHRCVACTFIPNDDETKTEVNHIDENKYNNSIENLEWTTRLQNAHHGTLTERISKKVKCVETGIIYESSHDASRKTGLSQSGINRCCNGTYKTCGGLHWEFVN